jgi:anti-sigma factor RsiW
MNCQDSRSLFNTYLDGELSGTLAAEFGAHRLSCPTCRRELALLEVAGHVVATDIDTPLLSEEFTERLLSIAAPRPAPWYRRRRPLVFAGVPLAAAACLAFALVPRFLNKPTPRVLDQREVVETSREMLQRVERALESNPDNAGLQELAARLRTQMNELEIYGQETIMEVLRSIPLDSPGDQDEAPAPAEPAGENHDPPVEDL